MVPAADTKQAVLDAFGELLDFPEDYGMDLDALHDSLHDFADAVTDDGEAPSRSSGRSRRASAADRSFGVICETCRTPKATPARAWTSSPSASRALARHAVTVRPRVTVRR